MLTLLWLIALLSFVTATFKTMAYTYKKQKTVRDGEVANNILRIEDNAFIPFDNNNIDYQDYLAWLAEGNTPQEAD